MPKLFNEEKNIEKLTGVYIPFWSYDLNVSGNINFKTSDMKTWSDYDYTYTKIDEYLSKKEANMTYNKVLVDGSSRFDDDLMDSLEPFDFNGLEDYNHAYLSGFFAEKYDIDQNKAIKRATLRAMNTSIDQVKKTVTTSNVVTVESNNLNIENTNADYILLPVWMVNIDYKGKKYTFAMNGQTREIVGNIPIDKKKAVIMFFIIFTTDIYNWIGYICIDGGSNMKKYIKISFLLVITLVLSLSNVFASTNTKERTESDYLVPNNIKITNYNKDYIIKTPAVDETEKVYDFADLFTDKEEQELYSQITKYISSYKMDLAVVTINENNKYRAQDYADDFYDYNNFGINKSRDGVLFLIDMDTRQIHMTTTGKAIKMYDDKRIDDALDLVYQHMTDQEYYTGTIKFINRISEYANSGFHQVAKIWIDKDGKCSYL